MLPAPEASTTRDLGWARPGLGEQVLPWGVGGGYRGSAVWGRGRAGGGGGGRPPGGCFLCTEQHGCLDASACAGRGRESTKVAGVGPAGVDESLSPSTSGTGPARTPLQPCSAAQRSQPSVRQRALQCSRSRCQRWALPLLVQRPRGPRWGVGRKCLCGSSGSFNF